MTESAETIRTFWFGDAGEDDDARIAQRQSRLWWAKEADMDRRMAERFSATLAAAARHACDNWAATPGGRLALILLTDQFPRNIYRDTPQAFAFDALARAWCKEGLRDRSDLRLRPIERVFYYLPLEHSESLADQIQAVDLFENLQADVPEAHKETFAGFTQFARRHRDVVQRFGRFPHRNRILGRVSTEDELVFLRQKASSF